MGSKATSSLCNKQFSIFLSIAVADRVNSAQYAIQVFLKKSDGALDLRFLTDFKKGRERRGEEWRSSIQLCFFLYR